MTKDDVLFDYPPQLLAEAACTSVCPRRAERSNVPPCPPAAAGIRLYGERALR
jgi:hypothetical protein